MPFEVASGKLTSTPGGAGLRAAHCRVGGLAGGGEGRPAVRRLPPSGLPWNGFGKLRDGRRPHTTRSSSWCVPLRGARPLRSSCATLWAFLRVLVLIRVSRRNGRRQSVATARCRDQDATVGYTAWNPKAKALHGITRLRVPGESRHQVWGPPDKANPRGQNMKKAGDALRPFQAAMEAPPEATSPTLEDGPLRSSEEGSLSRVPLLWVLLRATRSARMGMPRQWGNREPPEKGQEPPLQHPGR